MLTWPAVRVMAGGPTLDRVLASHTWQAVIVLVAAAPGVTPT